MPTSISGRTGIQAFVVLVAVFGGAVGLEAQVESASLTITTQSTPAMPGSVATASVEVQGSLPVSGFSFGVSHVSAILTLGSVVQGADLQATHGGTGAEFISIDISPAGDGFSFAAVIDTSTPTPTEPLVQLPANIPNQVAVMSYQVAQNASFGSTSLTFTASLGNPPVALAVGMGTVAIEPPTTTDGTLFTTIPFTRGDVNGSGVVSITDAIFLLDSIFNLQTPACMDAADTNGSGAVNINDAIFLLGHLFDEGGPLPAPAGACGVPLQPSTLGCASSPCQG